MKIYKALAYTLEPIYSLLETAAEEYGPLNKTISVYLGRAAEEVCNALDEAKRLAAGEEGQA